MNYTLVVIFSSSVLIGAVIGWLRIKKIETGYLPFIVCMSLASLNEIFSFIITRYGYGTAYNNNIYILCEALLITWQFKNWGLFGSARTPFPGLLLLILASWTIENIFMHKLSGIGFYFRIGYSFLVVLMSIHINTHLIITFRKNLFKSPVFLICSGFIIYFIYKILFETFWLYGLTAGRTFRINIYLVLTFTNLFTNLIYAAAILWIPRKPQFIAQP